MCRAYDSCLSDNIPSQRTRHDLIIHRKCMLRELMDIDDNPINCFSMFRMDRTVFDNLRYDLVT